MLYPCHKTEENLRETGELNAGGVNIFLVQYGPNVRQIDKPEELLQKTVKHMIGQENEGTERSYLACVLQQISDSQILKQNPVLILLSDAALCLVVVVQSFEENYLLQIN